MTKSKMMDISQVAKSSGFPVSTLRFYEEKGLIQSTGRHGLRRLFDDTILERLALIALGQSAGFTLEEIGKLLTVGGHREIDRDQLSAKADELDKQIKQLTAMRDGLRHAANCSAPSHWECPKFRRILRLAGKKRSVQKENLTPYKV